MARAIRGLAVVALVVMTSVAWWVLSAVTFSRTATQQQSLQQGVAELWGEPLRQEAPHASVLHTATEWEDVLVDKERRRVQRQVQRSASVPLAGSQIEVTMAHDPRRKGLIWFSLYDVSFDARYRIEVPSDAPAERLSLRFPFPQHDGYYDDFRFEIDGHPVATSPSDGAAVATVAATPGQVIEARVAYRSRGRDSWTYQPVSGWQAGEVRDFSLVLHTDFADIDFPGRTLSPSERAERRDGWTLAWRFDRLVTGSGVGMVTPTRVQPGELASRLSVSAPISLVLFTVWVSAIALLRRIEIHPLNHAFVAAAFFSFHLLFGYVADHLPVEAAFALASVVSVFLTVSYLRLVAGPRFATVQAGGAQLVYQVGFGLAHFVDGMTGLTVTVLLIGTLFALMQLTGRLRWSEVLSAAPSQPSPQPAAG